MGERIAKIEDQLASIPDMNKTMKAFMHHLGINSPQNIEDHELSDCSSGTEESVPVSVEINEPQNDSNNKITAITTAEVVSDITNKDTDVSANIERVDCRDLQGCISTQKDLSMISNNEEIASTSLNDRCSKYETIVKTAPPVSEDIAKFVTQAITHNMDSKSYQQLSEKYQVPENIPFLVAPRINSELWGIIPFAKQQQDISRRKSQEKLVNGIRPLVSALEECGNKPELEKVKELISDSIELLSHVSMNINNIRREELKPHLKNAAPLASRSTPITDMLFGNEVEAEIKKIDAKAKLTDSLQGKAIKKSFKYSRAHPYQYKPKVMQQYGGGFDWKNKFETKDDMAKHLKEKAKSFLGSKGSFGGNSRNQTKLSRKGKKFYSHQKKQRM